MKFSKVPKVIFPVLLIALILVFIATTSYAQEATKISGKITAAYTQEEPFNVGDTEGHIVNLTKSEGTNENMGKQEFMAGAHVVNMGFSDLVKGNGKQQGYVIFVNNADTTIAKWEGKVTTTIGEEDKPVTSFEGTYTYIYGTGKFKNISGNGTYKGGFTSEAKYWADWQGEYTLGK